MRPAIRRRLPSPDRLERQGRFRLRLRLRRQPAAWMAALALAAPAFAGLAEAPPTVPALDDGPHVIWTAPGEAEVVRVEAGVVRRATIRVGETPVPIDGPAGGPPILIARSVAPPPPAVQPMPSRVLAISDLEGNHAAMLAFLAGHGVVDAAGRWAWGDGHLVCVGDMVDRGAHVTEVLWTVRRLEREAAAAGGAVHFVLGNHESMVMAGDLRYVHPKYTEICERVGRTYDALHGADTELGRWLRTRPSVVRLGDLLFVHGGISPAVADLGLSIEAINDLIRSRLGTRPERAGRTLASDLSWHVDGPHWYRGFHALRRGEEDPLAAADVDRILTAFGAGRIVVGHTVVEDVMELEPSGRLIGIDVRWSRPGEAEGLLAADGALWRALANGDRVRLSGPVRPDRNATPPAAARD